MKYLVNVANINVELEYIDGHDVMPTASCFFTSNAEKPDIIIKVNVMEIVNISNHVIPDIQTSAWSMTNIQEKKSFEFFDKGITIAKMLVNEDYTQICLDISRSSLHDIMPPIFVMVPIISGYLLLNREGFLFHGALVRLNGRGVILTGKSGAGKSTLSRLFSECGYEKIGDDRLILRMHRDGNVVAYSTPFDLKMNSWVNDSCTVSSIMFLEHSPDEYNYVTKMEGKEAVNKIIYTNFLPFFAMDKFGEHVAMCHEMLKDIPMFNYAFVPTISSVSFVEKIFNES